MKLLIIFGLALAYLLIGQIYTISYQIAFPAERERVWLGFMGLFWPLYLILDVVMQIAYGFGHFSKLTYARAEKLWTK